MLRGGLLSGILFVAIAAAVPAQAQGPAGGLSSSNLEHIALFPLDGRANGAKRLGRYLYVTTGKTLEILDVSEPNEPPVRSASSTSSWWTSTTRSPATRRTSTPTAGC